MGRHPGMDKSRQWHRALERDTRPSPPRWTLGRGAFVYLLLSGLIVLIAACAVSKPLERTPGVDLSPVKIGTTRQQVEAVVGDPLREWTTRRGVRYRLYRYDAGIDPSAGGAAVELMMDIMTLGGYEAMHAASPEEWTAWKVETQRKWPLLAVSYDSQEIVIGVFKDVGEFDEFPEDGCGPAPVGQGANGPIR